MFRLEVIDFVDQSNQALVARVPELGTAAIQFGAQLIVQQSQEAVFFRDGRAMDSFGSGRYTLTTSNIPILTKILTIPWEKSPFQACVYFVGKQTFIDQRWGTRQPITLRDKDFGLVRLRGFGKYAFRVSDASLLINTLVGTQGKLTTDEINSYLKDLIVSGLTDLLASSAISLLDLPAKFDEVGAAARLQMSQEFAKFGLELTQFNIASISPPEEVQKAIDARSSMAAIGDLRSFTIYQAATGMAAAGQNPGGMGAAGIGLGMGMVLPNLVQQALQSAPPAPGPKSPNANSSNAASIDFTQLKVAQDAPSARQMVESLAKQSNWQIDNQGDSLSLTITLSPLRKQQVIVGFGDKDNEGHSMVSFLSPCGFANPSNALTLLRYNNQLVHGAFAIRRVGDADQLIIRANLLADTMDLLEISRTVAAVAWQADQVEQQMAGATDGL